MSPAAGVEGDNVAPDYPRDSKVVPARAHRVQCLPVMGEHEGGPPQRGAAAPA